MYGHVVCEIMLILKLIDRCLIMRYAHSFFPTDLELLATSGLMKMTMKSVITSNPRAIQPATAPITKGPDIDAVQILLTIIIHLFYLGHPVE